MAADLAGTSPELAGEEEGCRRGVGEVGDEALRAGSGRILAGAAWWWRWLVMGGGTGSAVLEGTGAMAGWRWGGAGES